jgi:uncharacterized protein (TIGR03118 family)
VSKGEHIMRHLLIKGAAQAAIVVVSMLGTVLAGAAGGFIETDLRANKSPLTDGNGIVHTAPVDANLVNPWGIATSTSSPFWVSDNNSGLATLYNSNGVPQALVVSIPLPGAPLGNGGAPTGTVFNTAQSLNAFPISGVDKNGKPTMAPAVFLFATEDGTILGWNPAVHPVGDPNLTSTSTHAIIAVDRSTVGAGAVYKGLAIATDSLGVTRLYATNFRAGTVEVFNTNFTLITPPGGFTDPKLPQGYAPFDIFPIGSATLPATAATLVVTYAMQDAAKHDDVAGESHGIVNTFDLGGQSFQRLIQHGQLNSPWGVAVAPKSFGALAGALLIGNFGNGHIDAYNPNTGVFIDKVRDPHGQVIVIDGLWSLRVGNGGNGGDVNTIYFTAGPNGEQDGLFGTITPSP